MERETWTSEKIKQGKHFVIEFFVFIQREKLGSANGRDFESTPHINLDTDLFGGFYVNAESRTNEIH